MDPNKDIIDFKNQLNAVSPSFCIAKWKQVTLHLQTGHTHSCHHPTTHKIPLEEIAIDASALHNTSYKKKMRKLMLEGQRPAECDYCWKVEDQSNSALSDRIYKSYDAVWGRPYYDEVRNLPWNSNVDPSYLEVSFSSVCNFKCSYCTPQVSSTWMEEIQRHGAYPTSSKFNSIQGWDNSGQMPIPHNQYNPYVEAFWRWWPQIYTKLKHFRITGGEPLLAKDTFKVLDYIIDNPNPEIDFSVNSNLCVPTSVFNKFIEKVQVICSEKKVKKFKIFTSCDSYGQQAEYIRYGLNYQTWLENLRRVLTEIPGCTVTIMSTYNVMSIPGYSKFLNDVLTIKNEFGGPDAVNAPLILDVPYLRYPVHQNMFYVMPPEWTEQYLYDQVTFMYKNLEVKEWPATSNRGFFKWEADKFRRIYEMAANQAEPAEAAQARQDFVAFVDEHDRRRGTNFLECFPEFADYYHKWR